MNKPKKIILTTVVLAALGMTTQAEDIISSVTNNGGFVSAASDFNGSPEGWLATAGVWVDSGNSGLTSAPFGADSVTDSRFVQIHNDGGETLTSSVLFSVEVGNTIELSFDYKTGGSGGNTTLTATLWDSVANATYATLGSIDTSTSQPGFTQIDYSHTASSSNENLHLRFSLSAGGKDIHIDRVHLSGGTIVPPEPPAPIVYDTLQYLDPSDSEAIKVEKAAKLLPRSKQVDWQRLETTYFIHFGPNTFNGVEWGNGFETPGDFNPTAFDAAQWVDVIKQANGKMLMLVVKHHEGFCLYPSRYTDHDVTSSPWLGGAGDVVRAVSDACAAEGIKFGVYLSPADLYQIESSTDYAAGSGYYGHGSSSQTSSIPTDPASFNSNPLQGRTPPSGYTSYQYEADDYNRYFLNQLYELLTEYGDIDEVWFDGATPKTGPQPQAYNRQDWYDLINKLQPGANIAVKGPDVRWVGNEHGYARETEWSGIPIPQHPSTYAWNDQTATDLGSRAKLTGGNYLTWWPAEADTKVLSGWFWKASHGVKSTGDLIDIYYGSVGRNANLLLNLSPDTRGLIPDNQITPLLEAMSAIQQTFGTDLAAGGTLSADSMLAGQPTANALDGDLDTYWEADAGTSTPTLTLTLPSSQTIDRVVLQEAIAVRGMRIENFAVDTWNGASWVQRATKTCVGHKRIIQIPETTTDQVRIRIIQSRLEPTLASISLHKSATVVPVPAIGNRAATGKVVITASSGNSIYYTLDGSTPTTASSLYAAPVDLPLGGTVKAISHDGSSASYTASRYFGGMAPIGWNVISVDSEEAPGNDADLAIDDDPDTYWHTALSGSGPHPHHLTVDMGTNQWIGGFSYLPRNDSLNGVVKTYRFEVSEDNSSWTNVSESEFLNIKNSPVLQTVFFASPVKARYFRFTSLSEVNGANFASAAEIGVLPGGYDQFRQDLGMQTALPTDDIDADKNGLLLEYYFGTNPFVADGRPLVFAPQGSDFQLEVVRATPIDDITSTVRYTVDLTTNHWLDATVSGMVSTNLGGGLVRDTYTVVPPADPQAFFRVRISR